jgi:hypothetical protein
MNAILANRKKALNPLKPANAKHRAEEIELKLVL